MMFIWINDNKQYEHNHKFNVKKKRKKKRFKSFFKGIKNWTVAGVSDTFFFHPYCSLFPVIEMLKSAKNERNGDFGFKTKKIKTYFKSVFFLRLLTLFFLNVDCYMTDLIGYDEEVVVGRSWESVSCNVNHDFFFISPTEKEMKKNETISWIKGAGRACNGHLIT